MDSYSGFGSRPEVTNLGSLLEKENIGRVICVGLAFDYCVGSTALDAASLGFETYIVRDATKSVSSKSAEEMQVRLDEAGVMVINSEQINLRKRFSNIEFKKTVDEDERCLCIGEGAGGPAAVTDDPYDHLPPSALKTESEGAYFNPCGW